MKQQQHILDHNYSSNSRLLLYVAFFLVLILNRERLSTILILPGTTIRLQPRQTPTCQTCGGCYCISSENNINSNNNSSSTLGEIAATTTIDDTCPIDDRPTETYSSEWIQQMKELRWLNPITISCDPYTNSSCDTNEYPLPTIESGVEYNCVVDVFNTDDDNDNRITSSLYDSYRTRTFQGSVQQAQELGLYVTHTGPCGMCSNLNDLSVYIDKALSLRQLSTICGFAGIVSKRSGMSCFEKLVGFTKGCSQIWYYNTVNTRKHCSQCFYHTFAGTPLQSDAPYCQMNDCLQCDENKSGPYFSKFAGRNRRNSGILTDIVRNCSEFQSQLHHHFIPSVR
jgi:hypothetical protein